MGTKGSQPLLLANREGFLEEVTSGLPLEREVGRMLRLDGKWGGCLKKLKVGLQYRRRTSCEGTKARCSGEAEV